MNRAKFFLAISLLSRVASSFAMLVVIARALSPSQYGLVVAVLTYSQIAAAITDFGFAVQVLRDIGARPEKAGYFTAQCIRAKSLLVLLVTAIAVACLLALGPNLETIIIASALYISVIANSYSDLLLVTFRGTGRYGAETIIVAISSVLLLSSVVVVSLATNDLPWLALAIVLPRLAQVAMTFLAVMRHVELGNLLSGRISETIGFIRDSSSVAFDALLNLVTAQLDIVAVSMLLGLAAVGNYQIAARSAAFLLLPSQVFSGVYLPTLARARETADGTAERMENRYVLEYFLVGLGLAVPFAMVMPFIYGPVFGDQYEIPSTVWAGFAALVVLRYMSAILGTVLISRRDVAVRVFSQIAGAVILAVLLFTVTPTFGPSGAAWSLASSIGITAGLYAIGLIRLRRRKAPTKKQGHAAP